jgi:hypothetical protein
LLTYSRYLHDVINNEFLARDVFGAAYNQKLSFKLGKEDQGGSGHDTESLLFGEGSFFTMVILRTDFTNLGIVESANHEMTQMFGYKAEWLVGKDISALMPDPIGVAHRQMILKFFDKPDSRIVNHHRELFVRDANGYLAPVLIYP